MHLPSTITDAQQSLGILLDSAGMNTYLARELEGTDKALRYLRVQVRNYSLLRMFIKYI